MNNWKKKFYTIWVGQAFSQLSSSVLQFAVVWYLTDMTDSGLVLTLAMLMGFLPQGLLGPFVGVYIDRWNRKAIMIAADMLIAGVSLVLVFSGSRGIIPTGLVLFVLLIRAIGTAFHTPTLAAVTPQLVPAEELTRCAGYTQALQSVSMIASPALAALLYANWPLGRIVLLDVAGALIASSLVAVVKIPEHKGMAKTEKIHILQEVREGFAILSRNRGILGLVGVGALYTVAMMPVSALFPLMSMGRFGGTSTHASIVEVVFSVGFMLGSLILGRWGGTRNKVYTIVLSYLMMAFALLVSGLLPTGGFAVFVVMSAIMGISGPFYWGVYTPLLQQSYSEEYMGRVMSITGSIRLCLGPAALVVSGLISDSFGVSVWFLAAGALVLIGAVLILSVPVIRRCGETIVPSAENEER